MFRQSRHSTTLLSALLAVAALGALPAKAGIVNIANVSVNGSPYRAFQDTTTGLAWLDLDNLFFTDTTYTTLAFLHCFPGRDSTWRRWPI